MIKYDKRILAIGIAFIGLFILGIIGFTYAFFTGGVVGNPAATPTVVETADLRLVFTDTQVITMNNVLPGASQTKTFTISNVGNGRVNYDINIIDVTNTFDNNDLIYSLTSTNGGAAVTNTLLPSINGTLVSGTIEPGITQTYTMTILFKETGINQNTNQGAVFAGKLQINSSGLISDEVTFSISETLGTVAPNQTKKVNILGNYYGTVSCTSGDTNIAECTSTQNEISILGKSAGTTNITVTENNKNLETTYTVTIISTFYNTLLSNNTSLSDSSINFSQPSSETNGKGLYYTEDNTTYGEDGQRIYYFRGAVNNNWVSFGGYLWRIVRTTSEGGVKLAYSGDGSETSSAFINTATPFNSSFNNKYNIGYTYNTDLSGYTGAQTDSTIKGVIDTWYTNNLSSYASYLSNTAIYCNDRSSEFNEGGDTYYPEYDRLSAYCRPTYACLSANASRYIVSTETGNGYLSNPIALLTADEINYAGVRWGTGSLDSYIMENATSTNWWTMSPYYYFMPSAYELYVNTTGYLEASYANSTYGVRSSVSLKSCITVSEGNGSKSTPYILSNSECV